MNAKQITAIENLRDAYLARMANDNGATQAQMGIAMTNAIRTGLTREQAKAAILG